MIQRFADWLVYDIFGLDASTALGKAINFFFYDTIKILILLFFISVIMGIINAYFPIERLRNYLTSRKLYGLQYFFAALFGAITPFCSCSSIPLFIGFVKGGIPLGVTFAYLITSPLVNEVAVALFIGTFGLRITIIYVISGVLLGMVGGFILGKMKLEAYLSDWVKQIQQNSTSDSGIWEKSILRFLDDCQLSCKKHGVLLEGCFCISLSALVSVRLCMVMCRKDSSNSICLRKTGLQYLYRLSWQFQCMPMLPE